MQASGIADGAFVEPCGSGFRLNCGLIRFGTAILGMTVCCRRAVKTAFCPAGPTRTGETRFLIRRGLIIIYDCGTINRSYFFACTHAPGRLQL